MAGTATEKAADQVGIIVLMGPVCKVTAGVDGCSILGCVRVVLDQKDGWTVPPEYLVPGVSATVTKILTGYSHGAA